MTPRTHSVREPARAVTFAKRIAWVATWFIAACAIAFAEGLRVGADLSWPQMIIAAAVLALWTFGAVMAVETCRRWYADVRGSYTDIREALRKAKES